MKKCGEMGFHGITVPERFGGLDLGYITFISELVSMCLSIDSLILRVVF